MIDTVGIIGAGTMGNGIAQVCASAGVQVVMVDISDAAVSRGLATVGNSLDRLVKKEKMTAADREAALSRITATTDKAKLNGCDLVIEAATENEELKIKILKDLCASLQPRALPPQHDAPVTLTTVTRIGTKDGSPPPILQKLVFIVDKHGSIDAEGVPVCTMAKLADTTPSEARKRCAGSLVGEGTGKAVVAMPGQAPVPISSPLSFFNGPKVGGTNHMLASSAS